MYIYLQHAMEFYNQMVLRSYLDKPDKYIPPSQTPPYRKMKMLSPVIRRVELHEYPNEHVLVLEGENLLFSFKITLDEGGRNEYLIKSPHSVTKCSLQFNFTPSHKVSSAIQDGEMVKVTVHTHFVTKVLKSVDCKKVYLCLKCTSKHWLFIVPVACIIYSLFFSH